MGSAEPRRRIWRWYGAGRSRRYGQPEGSTGRIARLRRQFSRDSFQPFQRCSHSVRRAVTPRMSILARELLQPHVEPSDVSEDLVSGELSRRPASRCSATAPYTNFAPEHEGIPDGFSPIQRGEPGGAQGRIPRRARKPGTALCNSEQMPGLRCHLALLPACKLPVARAGSPVRSDSEIPQVAAVGLRLNPACNRGEEVVRRNRGAQPAARCRSRRRTLSP